MTGNELKAVIFDLDDTLYPEVAFVESGFRAVAKWVARQWSYDCDEVATSLAQLYRSGVRGNTFAAWLTTASQITTDVESAMVDVYRTHRPHIAPFADAHSVLHELRQRYQLGLVSDGILAVQRNKWEALQLSDYFHAILFSDELGREFWKPSPRPFEAILRRLDTSPHQAVYIADNVAKDFLAPRQLGMGTIQVSRPGSIYSHLQPATKHHSAHCVVGNLRQACERIGDLRW